MIRRALYILVIILLSAGCATAPVASVPPEASAPAPLAADRAACRELARSGEQSAVFRAALAHGALGTGLMTLYAAANGAAWGAIAGGGRSEGAWIGAAVGGGVGLVLGIIDGIERAQETRARYRLAYDRCLSERGRRPGPGGA